MGYAALPRMTAPAARRQNTVHKFAVPHNLPIDPTRSRAAYCLSGLMLTRRPNAQDTGYFRHPMKREIEPPRATPVTATGAHAVAAVALGAIALGALAIGALAIGRLAIGRARVRRLQIDELVVRRLRVTEHLVTPPGSGAESES